jgi:hypothetical protein
MDTVIATMKPEVTHCTRLWPRVKCWLMSGMATFMMVDDMTAAMEPSMTVISNNQRCRSP